MTTLVRPDAPTGGGGARGEAAPRPHEPSRYAAWRSSWAVALRMARRDVRRHKGRSALVVVMVAVPTLLLSLVVTLSLTSEVDGVEGMPFVLGTSQALIEGVDGAQVLQGADPQRGSSSSRGTATPIPGFDPAADAFVNAEAMTTLVGSPVVPLSGFQGRASVGERRISVDGLAVAGPQGLGQRLRLLSGRWPTGPSEALVTEYGRYRGLPDSGRLTVTVEGADHTYDIVGLASASSLYGSEGLVVAVPPTGGAGVNSWLVPGPDPVTWADVRRLNDYGLRVTSRQVLLDPPSVDQLPAELQEFASGDADQVNLVVGMGAAMLLIVTALLVGPAFAVSATRQRRTLALAASNGASTPVLRRTVLAQALVLGGTSALVGTALGVAITPLVLALFRSDADFSPTVPLDIRWGLLAGIALCALGSTLVAALAPARRLGRLDIVGVMRGQSVSPRPSLFILAAGVVLTLLGAFAVLGSTGAGGLPSVTELIGMEAGGEFAVTIGAVVLILGTLFLVPVILAGVGRLGGHLPTTLRMAARDLARHRSRSAPSVAAVLAAVAGLTFGLTGLASDTEQNRRDYQAQALPGEAVINLWGPEKPSLDPLRAAAPGLVFTENAAFDTGDPSMTGDGSMPTEPYRVGFLNVVPPGCTPERTVQDDEWFAAEDARFRAAEAAGTQESFVSAENPCMAGGASYSSSGQILLLPADEIIRRLGLDAARADAVRAGAVVTRELPVSSTRGSTVRIARGTSVIDPTATAAVDPDVQVEQEVDLPLLELPRTSETEGKMLNASLVLAADGSVAKDWPTRAVSLTVRDPSGAAVTDAAAEKLQQALGDELQVSVERGFSRDDAVIVAVLLGVFALLILVITLTSTALTLAEQQTDQATLAALGATRGTRRLMAGAAAFLLAAVGCVLGVAVGLVPGVAIARPLTSSGWTTTGLPDGGHTILVIPWLSLLVVGLLVPLVAGAIAWAGIRRAPQVTRRAT
jgi:putative ABC transport system permease protein